MFDSLLKTKYRMKLMKKLNEGSNQVYDERKTLIIDPVLHEVSYHGHPYSYSLTEISHRKGNKAFIYKDIDDGQTIMKMGSDDWHKPTDGALEKGKMRLAKAAFNGGTDLNLLYMVLLLVGGVIIGAVLTNLPAISKALGGA